MLDERHEDALARAGVAEQLPGDAVAKPGCDVHELPGLVLERVGQLRQLRCLPRDVHDEWYQDAFALARIAEQLQGPQRFAERERDLHDPSADLTCGRAPRRMRDWRKWDIRQRRIVPHIATEAFARAHVAVRLVDPALPLRLAAFHSCARFGWN